MRGGVTALAAVCVAVCACGGPIEVTHVLTGPPLPSRPEGAPLPVYVNEAPAAPYREVAQIRVRATGEPANADAVIASAARDAREVGADAIIVDTRRHYHSVEVWIGCDGSLRVAPGWRLNARVTAIQFVPEGAAQPEAPPTGPSAVEQPCR